MRLKFRRWRGDMIQVINIVSGKISSRNTPQDPTGPHRIPPDRAYFNVPAGTFVPGDLAVRTW